MTFRGETARNYVTGVVRTQGDELERQVRKAGSPNTWTDGDIQTRFRYNQAFLSVNAMVPSVFMLMLCLIPAIMSAIAVVREKETGSIANFPFDADHQIRVPARQAGSLRRRRHGEFRFSAFDGDLRIRRAAQRAVSDVADRHDRLRDFDTGFGQLISSFTRTQVAAVFATAILSIVPAVNFSGLFAPVSSLSGTAKILGLTFPSAWYQPITVGVFAKALGMSDLWFNVVAIFIIALAYLVLSLLLLRKQEA